MRNYLLAAVAATALATPGIAAADGPYVAIEGGVTIPQSTDLDIIFNNTTASPTTSVTYGDGYQVSYKTGYDVDLLAGYKLGLLRLEAEGGYQRANVKNLGVSSTLLTDVGTATGSVVTAANFSVGNDLIVKKLMANALVDGDFGGGFGGYVGGGAGRAWADLSGDSDSAWAYQGIAGLRYALTRNLNAGVKYEYFRTGKLNFNDAFADFQDRYIKCTAAKVEHRDRLVLFLIETISERGRGRLVDNAHHLQAGDLSGILGGLTLRVVKIRRYGDDGFVDLLSEVILSRLLHLLQDDC